MLIPISTNLYWGARGVKVWEQTIRVHCYGKKLVFLQRTLTIAISIIYLYYTNTYIITTNTSVLLIKAIKNWQLLIRL